jgi:hypothetical protein
MRKIQLKTVFGSLIFESEKENNSVKEAVKDYINQELNKGLRSADLSYADLSYADLSYANLRYADLRSADLSSANLSSANLDKRYISIAGIGSSKRMTTYCFEDDVIWCGCFKGSLSEFKNTVEFQHRDNEKYLNEYLGFINYLELLKNV